MTVTDRRYGVLGSLAMKAPCRLATTADITLSGLQSIDGTTTAAEDRVLVKDQDTATENGIYVASSSTWERATDFDSGDEIANGTAVFVTDGTVNANTLYRLDCDDDITIDTTSLTFSLFVNFDGREILAAARTYYVRTDGSDSNTGLADTAGGAFLTIQKAVDTASALDFNGYAVTVQLAAGTYTGTVVIGPMVGQVDVADFTITGASSTETNFVVSTTSATAIEVAGGRVALIAFKMQTTTGGHGLRVTDRGIAHINDVNFGAVGGAYDHISIDRWSRVYVLGNYTISGAATSHISCITGEFSGDTTTITVSGTPAFTQFVYAGPYARINVSNLTFSGAATGSKFLVDELGFIDVGGSGTSATLPGSTAGTITSGGGGRYAGATTYYGIEQAQVIGNVTVASGTPGLEGPSRNVTSITDTGTGLLTVTIATDFTDDDSTWALSVTRDSTASLSEANQRFVALAAGQAPTATALLECWNGTSSTASYADPERWHFVAYGTQLST